LAYRTKSPRLLALQAFFFRQEFAAEPTGRPTQIISRRFRATYKQAAAPSFRYPMPLTPLISPASFNPWLGAGLVLANSLLLYYLLFYYQVSENDKLLYTPLLATLVVGQLAVVAAGHTGRGRVALWILVALGAVAAGLLWAGLLWLTAFARGFNH